MSKSEFSLDELLDPACVRQSSQRIFQNTKNGNGLFKLNLDKLPALCDFVLKITKENYPYDDIPFHARWDHFRVGGVDRIAKFKGNNEALVDLLFVSILVDAGAGMAWRFFDEPNHKHFSKSEGLALASLSMFEKGNFSSNPNNPHQVDRDGLLNLSLETLSKGFQVSNQNPLTGLEGRLGLLKKLALCLTPHENRPSIFLKDLAKQYPDKILPAKAILKWVLLKLESLWPKRFEKDNINFGDVWTYQGHTLAFHKLSQWMSYSLIEPLEWSGFKVHSVNELTGLPEYRNGGLFLDFGVLELKDAAQLEVLHQVNDPCILEWRALTICLLDEIAKLVWEKTKTTPETLPLGKILQGGTWSAGRRLASEKRQDGGSPLKVQSDGTVF